MTSVWAERAGVRTPDLAAVTELDDGSMVLVYGMVKGRSIDSVAPEELTDGFLHGIWEQVAILRRELTEAVQAVRLGLPPRGKKD